MELHSLHHRSERDGPVGPCLSGAAGGAADVPEVLTFDEALDRAGTGRFQNVLLCVCGLGNVADAFEILAVGDVLPAVAEQAHGALQLSLSQIGWLSTCLASGALLGTVGWGLFSDQLGRKHALTAAMSVAGVFGLLSSASYSFASLALCRTLAGVGVGGSVPVLFAYLAEAVPAASRGRYVVALAACWMVGSVATSLLGLALVPTFPATGWRAFLALGSLPSLACAGACHCFASESARFLHAHGRHDEAAAVLRHAASANGRAGVLDRVALSPPHASSTSPQPSPPPRHPQEPPPPHHHAPPPPPRAVFSSPPAFVRQIRVLLSPPLCRVTLPLAFVWFALGFGWYGLVLWVPEFFTLRGVQAAQAAARLAPAPSLGAAPSAAVACLDARPFWDQLAVSAANLPGNVLSLYTIDRLGRRRTLFVSLFLGALCALAFAAAPVGSDGAALAAACAFNGVTVGAWNALDTYSAELLPTAVRATGLGLVGAAERLGSIIVQPLNGALLRTSLWAPLLPGCAVMLAGAAVVMRFLPTETSGKGLDDGAGGGAWDEGGFEGGDKDTVPLLKSHDALFPPREADAALEHRRSLGNRGTGV